MTTDLELTCLAQTSDDGENTHASPRRVWGSKAAIGALVGTALVLAVLGAVHNQAEPVQSTVNVGGVSELAQINAAQPLWQIDTTERDLCSKTTENCLSTKCCKSTNFRCFAENATYAHCAKECKKGSCEVLSRNMVLFSDTKPAKSLFCFAVYTANTGSTKTNYEKDLLDKAYDNKWHVFACDGYEVYSDVAASLGSGGDYPTKVVHDVDNTFHFAKRKVTGTWVNTGLFQQVWKAIGQAAKYQNFDWTIKVDADAVFFPHRLVQRIQLMPRASNGVFLTNCKHVDYGFFGSLEVFSQMAFNVLLANMDKCNSTLPWTIGIKDGEYGPMGEDLFAEICLEKNGVFKIEAFDIKVDGVCPGDRPKDQKLNKKWQPDCKGAITPAMHPFKKPKEWENCHKDSSEAETRYIQA